MSLSRFVTPRPTRDQAPRARRLVVLLLLAALSPFAARPALASPDVVGDANGDGAFNLLDVFHAIDLLRRGEATRIPLADVARPCDGLLGATDGQRLLGAWLALEQDVPVASRCHREAIGEALAPPPPAPPRPTTLDDRMAEVARRVPQFGGLYLDEGELRVVLTDPSGTVLEEALKAIRRAFGRDRFDLAFVDAVAGDYSFTDLLAWKRVAEKLLERGAVTLVDADERRNRLRIGLADLAERERIAAKLARKGVPAAAVEFVERPPLRLDVDPLTDALREKQRPLLGGLFIEFPGSGCSLGFLAERYGTLGFVTASHCLDPMGQVNGMVIFQDGHQFNPPGPQELEDPIGFELVDPPFGCGGTCRSSDAVFVALDPDETGRLGRIAGSPGLPPPGTYFGHYDVLGKGSAVCGEEVRRVAALSGEVGGEVTTTCTGVLADTSAVVGAPPVTALSCQSLYAAPSQQGDSGGPVFRSRVVQSEVDLVGVHWGNFDGESAFSPIENVEWTIGPLDVALRNLAPSVEIVAPPDGSQLGGGFPVAELEAEVHDFERGGDCSACTASWYSGKDGPLGTTSWAGGRTGLDAVLGGGPGYRAITATVDDTDGNSAWDTIVLSTGNGPPAVWIDWPPSGASLYRNVPYSLQGSSFDPEVFHALPCADLAWTLSGPSGASFPTTGCLATVTFESAGAHVLTLTGEDDGNLSGSDTATLFVVDPPPAAPPVITFLSPAPQTGAAPSAWVTVTAQITDPGSSGTLAYEWFLLSPYQLVPGGPIPLGSGYVVSGDTRILHFRPSDHLVPGCGAVPYTVRLRATDSDGAVGQGDLPLNVVWPPC